MDLKRTICLVLTVIAMNWLSAQDGTSLRMKRIPWLSEQSLDSLLVYPPSIRLSISGSILADSLFSFDEGVLYLELQGTSDSLDVSYRVFPFKRTETFARKDTSIIRPGFEREEAYRYTPSGTNRTQIFDFGDFERRGSISRGIQIGNAQDLSVNSDLNLQLAGRLTDKISLLANISDDNIPIQTDGSTQQLQEFDQVFIKLYTDRSSLIAGDHLLRNGPGYFSQYFKKARGGLFETSFGEKDGTGVAPTRLRLGASVSRGKFSRNVIQGIEGNQGPYRLRGSDNEQFIIILSGTERVYIDGRLLKRGKEFDYIIDYNASEITFTANRRITKDRRIVVEFQYAERNYARSLFNVGLDHKQGGWHGFVDLYSEQDSRNQPLQQDLTESDRVFLSGLGDDIQNALVGRVDTADFDEEGLRYAIRDSLGYDTVFVFSTDADETLFQVSFTQVGQGNGDYVQDDFTANGRIFRWVPPDTLNGTLVRNGDYAPGILLVTPKVNRLFVAGGGYRWSEESWWDGEVAMSENDLNTFSDKDSGDDLGYALRFRGGHAVPVGADGSSRIRLKATAEQVSGRFNRLERFRNVEFERDWNIQPADLDRDQLILEGGLGFFRADRQRLDYAFDRFTIGSVYTGNRHRLEVDWREEDWYIKGKGSFLETDASDSETRFSRHIARVERRLGPVRLGFVDEREENFRGLDGDSLRSDSYRFYDWQTYVAAADTGTWNYKLYFRKRDDWNPLGDALLRSATADEYGVETKRRGEKSQLNVVLSWRELRLIRESLTTATAEENLLGRLDYRTRLLKGGLITSTFYELGSGLERRRQFVYIQVQPGQGIYVWNDYNDDGVRDLDEFEIAQFQYDADFIRVFTPTDSFERIFTNQFAQNLSLEPGRWWKGKDGILGILARFSDQAVWRADRRTRGDDDRSRFDPFLSDVQDSLLLSTNSSIRNSVFFNRASPIWSIDHSYTENRNKQLLTNGFETRGSEEHRVEARWTYKRMFTLRLSGTSGNRFREASYSAFRDFSIQEESLRPEFEWQPDRQLRLTLFSALTQKSNRSDDMEQADLQRAGLEVRYSQLDKGNLTASLEYVGIEYSGEENNPLAFEMLDGLRVGNNLTWNLLLQRSLSKNLELNITYNGRKSPDNPAIHAGGVQVRAFF